ncbi:hypothetical protein ACTJK6_22445 [Ralstonia sp. 22086]
MKTKIRRIGESKNRRIEESKNQNWPTAFEQRIGIVRMAQGRRATSGTT